jgi:hypothetical protein
MKSPTKKERDLIEVVERAEDCKCKDPNWAWKKPREGKDGKFNFCLNCNRFKEVEDEANN